VPDEMSASPPARELDQDTKDLHAMGYAQELDRRMSKFSNFAVSFTIISILSGCLTLYGYGLLHGGPPVMLWGWLLVGTLVIFAGMSLGEICSSFPTAGGLYYWAAKLAHTEPKRLRGAVNWGAGVHRTFQEEWLRPALTLTASQYLMGPASLLDARSYIFTAKSLEEVLKTAPTLSLVTQGLIDQPCAPLLCINGKDDDQHPISDLYLLAEHGSPKDLRIIAGAGHMGRKKGQSNDEVVDIVTQWLKEKLA